MNFQTTKYLEELDDVDDVSAHTLRRKGKRFQKKLVRSQTDVPLGKVTMFDPVTQLGKEIEFKPTFSASKLERAWILEYLSPFYEDHFIADVLHQVKGGKEATVYCCRAHPRLQVQHLAAKVYRPKIFRTLKNDAEYRQGRTMRDDENQVVRGRREKLAMKKKTDFGQELLHNAWLTNEYQHLLALHAAGVEVAKPIAQSGNVILMEYVGDAGMPAPTLNTVRLAREEAQALFDRVLRNIALMLAHDCVHADLSAFNILYWDGDIRIIDFPQAINPYVNPDAFKIFERDIARVCQYFERYGVDTNARQLARELWKRSVKRDSSEVFLGV
ncbi:RIO kinase 1 [Anaerolineae bacterium]|nr:RIO kinase 1 [Anaerolineae bacterium]